MVKVGIRDEMDPNTIRALKLITRAEKLLEEVLPKKNPYHLGKLTLCQAYHQVKQIPDTSHQIFRVRFSLGKLDNVMMELVKICYEPGIIDVLEAAVEEIDFTTLEMHTVKEYIAWYSAFTPITSEKILSSLNAYRAHKNGDMTQNALYWTVYRHILVKAMMRMIAAQNMNVQSVFDRFHVNPTFRPNLPRLDGLFNHMTLEIVKPPALLAEESNKNRLFFPCTIC